LAKIASLRSPFAFCWNPALRNCDGFAVRRDVKNLAGWNAAKPAEVEIPFNRLESCSRISPASRPWSIWPPCARDETVGRRSQEIIR